MGLGEQPEFKLARPVLEKLEEAGYQAYFVGGCIRDALLGLPIHDVDIATSAYPEEVQQLFPRHFDVGIQHGTVMVWYEGETYEITTFRTESDYEDFRRPKHVTFVRNLKDDLLRRDFTINALAMDLRGHITDYFHGQEDLQKGLIRAVGNPRDRFHEDALRMMRAVRFASQLDFVIEEKTLLAIQDNAPLLEKIAVERTLVEMDKLWLGKNWQKGLADMLETDLYAYCPKFGDQKAALELMLEELSSRPFASTELAWAVFLYLGQNKKARSFCKAWKMSNQSIQKAQVYQEALTLREEGPFDREAVYRLGGEACRQVEDFILDQEGTPFARRFSRPDPDYVDQIDQALPIHKLNQLAIGGNELIERYQPKDRRLIGIWLRQLEKAVVLGQVSNQAEDLFDYLDQGLRKDEED